jgi:NAD(P)-dependent dehydrogenase (short-subunit alcohol dehydrogenase family)
MIAPDASAPFLAGRRALVTGASRRLGRVIALALGGSGADVAVHYRRDAEGASETVRLLRVMGRRASLHAADVAVGAACSQLIEEVTDALGGLDILVNNAATFVRTPLDEMSVEDFDHHMGANARSVFALSLAAGREMPTGADIVNIADVAAARPWPAYVPYSASKAAVVSLTRGFARALAPRVRVNAVAPGPVLPPENADEAQGRRAVEATLLKRWGTPDDVASAVLFLLRATYLTGVVLHVDGGRSIA